MTRYTVSFQVSTICIYIYTYMHIPSRELTYLTLAKGKSSSNIPWEKDMLVPRRVYIYFFAFCFSFWTNNKISIEPKHTGHLSQAQDLLTPPSCLALGGAGTYPLVQIGRLHLKRWKLIYIYYIYAYYVFYILYIWFIMFHKSMVSIF